MAPQFPPVVPKPKRFQRVPPAVFPAVMGGFGLGLALRRAGDAGVIPLAIGEMFLGAVSLLWAFAVLCYLLKLGKRPSVLLDDLKVLPGRVGLSAMTLGVLLLAATFLPYNPPLAIFLMKSGLALHGGLAVLLLYTFWKAPAEQRLLNPAWHLHFVGFIIAGLVAAPLGYTDLGVALLLGTGAIAFIIWAVSANRLPIAPPPPPLRPLLAIHLAPASLLGSVAHFAGFAALATIFAGIAGILLIALVFKARWLTASGFSPFWGAFTFPLAACASLFIAMGGLWLWAGILVLLAALAIIPPIIFKVVKAWADGSLAQKSNAAIA